MQRRRLRLVTLAALLYALTPHAAQAFCGFYVTGADTSLYANATMVVLMRDGTRTVLSMQNNYQGPPENFALVIPVPSVLTQDQVKTLPRDVFQHVDTLAAPRLVEYWELDPCQPQIIYPRTAAGFPEGAADSGSNGVTVEARFTVGEYDVVILSANDSTGLETWLHDNQYNIPNGADKVLAPYVAAGTKFFVAKVDPARVTFDKGQAALSPLRFNYDTQDFSLPVRLGLLNSQGTQDLIVTILAPSRYEVANHSNVTIPTNIRVQNDVRDTFPSFYEALFAKTVEKNPSAVVTEYAWNANSCDPCPTPPLTDSDLATLGADVTRNAGTDQSSGTADYVLTRLHYRYTQDTLGDDLTFKQAPPLVGGRGIPDAKGKLEATDTAATSGDSVNNFQGRYVILHPWADALTCQSPMRGQWGGPDGSRDTNAMPTASKNTALIGAPPQPGNLAALLAESISSLDVTATAPLDPLSAAPASAGTGSGDAGHGGSTAGKAGSAGVSGAGQGGSGSVAGKGGSQATALAGASAGPTVNGASSKCSCQLAGRSSAPSRAAGVGFAGVIALVLRRRARRRPHAALR